jgi:hypothetical protein
MHLRGHNRPLLLVSRLLQCPSSKEESSYVPASPCPVGIGLLALRTDTLFTPAPKRDRSFYLSIYVFHGSLNGGFWDVYIVEFFNGVFIYGASYFGHDSYEGIYFPSCISLYICSIIPGYSSHSVHILRVILSVP